MQIAVPDTSVLTSLEHARAIAQHGFDDPRIAAEQLALGEHVALSAFEGFKLVKDYDAARQARLGASYLGQAVDFRMLDVTRTGGSPELQSWVRGACAAAIVALDVAITAARSATRQGDTVGATGGSAPK